MCLSRSPLLVLELILFQLNRTVKNDVALSITIFDDDLHAAASFIGPRTHFNSTEP